MLNSSVYMEAFLVLSSTEMDAMTRVQILNETVYILLRTNNSWTVKNPPLPTP